MSRAKVLLRRLLCFFGIHDYERTGRRYYRAKDYYGRYAGNKRVRRITKQHRWQCTNSRCNKTVYSRSKLKP